MQSLTVGGVLFDMDGVLVDSAKCTESAWREWTRLHGVAADETYAKGHGLPTLEQIRAVAPELATADEAARLDSLEAKYLHESTALPGVQAAVEALFGARWGVVTSCGPAAAEQRLQLVGITEPPVLVTFDDVKARKPDPEPYLRGAESLGVEPEDIAVFEDAPSGIMSGKAAGAKVIALLTSHRPEALPTVEFQVTNLGAVTFRSSGERISVSMSDE